MNERRTFLKVLGGAAVAMVVPATTACSSDPASTSSSSSSNSSSSSGGAAGLKVSDVPVGSLVPDPGTTTLVGRDAAGLYAMSSLCTHTGCDLRTASVISATGIDCKCHASRFDRNGALLKGPATAPLVHFKVVVTAGTITVDTTAQVAATDRTAV